MISANSSSDILITIPNNSKPGGQIYYQNYSQSKLLFKNYELTSFVISITDDDCNLINFNGISSFFSFQFDIYRKYIPKLESFNNIVNLVNNSQLDNNISDESL